MNSLFPFQVLFFVSSEFMKCRLLKLLLAHPVNGTTASHTPRKPRAPRGEGHVRHQRYAITHLNYYTQFKYTLTNDDCNTDEQELLLFVVDAIIVTVSSVVCRTPNGFILLPDRELLVGNVTYGTNHLNLPAGTFYRHPLIVICSADCLFNPFTIYLPSFYILCQSFLSFYYPFIFLLLPFSLSEFFKHH